MPAQLPVAVHEMIASQHGVITRRQLNTLGVSDRVVARLVGAGKIIRLRLGAYVERQRYLNADPAARHCMNLLAIELQVPDAAASDLSAAVVWTLPLRTTPPRPYIIRGPGSANVRGAVVRRSDSVAPYLTRHAGLRVTTIDKTAIDVAAAVPFVEALGTVDAVLRRGVTQQRLLDVLAKAPPASGHDKVRRAVAAADPYAESWLESVSRGRMIERHMPLPLCNVVIRCGDRWVRVDFLLVELGVVGEADGEGKYRRPNDVRGSVIISERGRQAWLEDLGFEVARWGTPEVAGDGALMQRRIDREIGRQAGFDWPIDVRAEVPLLGQVIPPRQVVEEVTRLAGLGYPICFTDELGHMLPVERWAA